MKKNLMFRSTCTFGGTDIFPARPTDYRPIANVGNSNDCAYVKRNDFAIFYYDRRYLNLNIAGTSGSMYRSDVIPTFLLVNEAFKCDSVIALQAMKYDDLFSCSWTWLPYNYGTECSACTAFYANSGTFESGWVNTNCSWRFHLPCKHDITGHFTLTKTFHHIPNTGETINWCPYGYSFALPVTPRQKLNLVEKMLRHGVSHVWLPRLPGHTCVDKVSDISCGHPGKPANGVLIGDSFGFDSKVRYQCNVGWKLVGSKVRTCKANGNWTGDPASCHRVDCGIPPTSRHSKYYGTSTFYHDRYGYTCQWGFEFQGFPNLPYIVITCGADGAWSRDVPPCIRKTCQVTEWTAWSKCSAECGEGVQRRHRSIIGVTNEINGECPNLSEEQPCNTRKCNSCGTSEIKIIVEADNCKSSNLVSNRLCVGVCEEAGKCCKPTVITPKKISLYCKDSRPRNFMFPVVEECGCVDCRDNG